MKHQYSINMNSLEPQFLGCILLFLLLMTCEVHPKLFLKKFETLGCEHKFAFPNIMIDVFPFHQLLYKLFNFK
jgi:hypothetical protein